MGAESSKPSVVNDVDSVELTVKNERDGHSIPCKLWTPSSFPIRAAVVFIHGGMFSTGDRHSHTAVVKALVRDCRLAVLTATFRDGSCTTYASGLSLSDLTQLARFTKKKFPKHPLGVIGGSSGGWFAMQLCNSADSGDMIQFCIPLCPVAHPHARAIYLKHCIDDTTPFANGKDLYNELRHTKENAQKILDNQVAFFETFKQMSMAADEVSTNKNKIPTLLVLGAVDRNIPPNVTQNVQQQWAARTIVIGGAGHELQMEIQSDPMKNYILDLDRFLKSVLKEEETPPLQQRPWCS